MLVRVSFSDECLITMYNIKITSLISIQ